MGTHADIIDPIPQLNLPPGFRFYPTDEELLVQYLCRKIAGHHFSLPIIGEIDLYKHDPWVLPGLAIFGEKEWYFFSPRDRKYPNGSRPNRVAGKGYWKATGTDKVITSEGRRVGIKKALVFYVGKAPKGIKTNWIMHEYRISESSRKTGTGSSSSSGKLDDWVLCRIYKKNSSGDPKPEPGIVSKESSHGGSSSSSSSHFDDVLDSLPEINDGSFSLPRMNSMKALQQDEKINLQSLTYGNNFDWTSLAGIGTFSDASASAGQYNDVFMPTAYNIPELSRVEEEVQSEIRNRKNTDPLMYFQQNPTYFPNGAWMVNRR